MVGSEYSTKDCKSPKINIGAIMKILEMLIFVPDPLEIKKMCKNIKNCLL